MSLKKYLTLRVCILIFFLIIAILSISPRLNTLGVEVTYSDEIIKDAGITSGDIIRSVNNLEIKDIKDFESALESIKIPEKEIIIITDKSTVTYTSKGELGFELKNLTVINSKIQGLENNSIIKKIDSYEINLEQDFINHYYDILPYSKLEISTTKKDYSLLITKVPSIKVKQVSSSNIKKGLDLDGGARVILKPTEEVSEENLTLMIEILTNKLNIYGLREMKIRSVSDNLNNHYISIELAGATKEEIEEFVAKQGKFEARIGDDLVFTGEKRDIRYVCRGDGSCAGIQSCGQTAQNEYICNFEFAIRLSEEAAQKQAAITKDLDLVTKETGTYVNETLDLYLDGRFVSSLNIGKDLKGNPSQSISISGPGVGKTSQTAMQNALAEMNRLQTVMITGSLPFEMEIVSLEEVSPIMGEQFTKNALLIGVLAFLGVLAVVYIRYRKLKLLIPIAINLFSELLIVLGFAALFKWNLDLPSIAGFVASIGTGIDDQIVITDELLSGKDKKETLSWKQKIKRAFGIILTAYCTTFVAMIPLWNTAAGLLRGFAFTTIVGITIGVLITRPAFASMMEKILE